MPIATIIVQSTQPPAAGKKRGKVIATDNTSYQADASVLGSFIAGQTYNITYKDDSFNGFAFKVIERFNAAGAAQGMVPGNTPPPPYNPAAAAAPRSSSYGNKDEGMPERIFVCGALNASLGNPGINPAALTEDQLVAMVNGFRKTWARTFGASQQSAAPQSTGQQTLGQQMNDEIPF